MYILLLIYNTLTTYTPWPTSAAGPKRKRTVPSFLPSILLTCPLFPLLPSFLSSSTCIGICLGLSGRSYCLIAILIRISASVLKWGGFVCADIPAVWVLRDEGDENEAGDDGVRGEVEVEACDAPWISKSIIVWAIAARTVVRKFLTMRIKEQTMYIFRARLIGMFPFSAHSQPLY